MRIDTSVSYFWTTYHVKMIDPVLFFIYFCSIHTIYRINIAYFSSIRTRIVEVEGEHADHLTTTA